MDGLQICVRMTDGISFSLSSHCHSNKGLIEGAGAPARKKALGQGGRQEELEREHGGRIGKRHKERAGCHNSKSCYHSQVGRSAGRPATSAHLMVFHMLKPSSGFMLFALPPARPTKVGSQSEMWISSWLTLPGCCSSGLATNPTPRIPPSHSDHFLPRSGQLLPPDSV